MGWTRSSQAGGFDALAAGAAAAGLAAARGGPNAFMLAGKTAVPATMYQVMNRAQMKAPAA